MGSALRWRGFIAGGFDPSVRAQALSLLVNPNTVQRAYEQLERDGLIISKKGTGMVVAPDSRSMAQSGVEEGSRCPDAAIATPRRRLSRAAIDKLYRKAWKETEIQTRANMTSSTALNIPSSFWASHPVGSRCRE